MPKNAFGKLSPANFTISACHDSATVEQDSTAFTSQLSFCPGLRASFNVSAARMNDTNNATVEAISMIRYVHVAS